MRYNIHLKNEPFRRISLTKTGNCLKTAKIHEAHCLTRFAHPTETHKPEKQSNSSSHYQQHTLKFRENWLNLSSDCPEMVKHSVFMIGHNG